MEYFSIATDPNYHLAFLDLSNLDFVISTNPAALAKLYAMQSNLSDFGKTVNVLQKLHHDINHNDELQNYEFLGLQSSKNLELNQPDCN